MVNVTNYERELYLPHLIPGLATQTHTDADGRFTLSGLGRDRLAQLAVSAPRVVDTTLAVMTRDAPDVQTRLGTDLKPSDHAPIIHGAGFSLTLQPGRTISGVVRDVNSKKPIAGIWVGLRHVGGSRMCVELTSKNFPYVTDENGRFTITGLYPAQKKQVVVVAPSGVNYQSQSVMVEGDADVVIDAYPSIPFRLKLADAQGKPVDAEVTFVDLWPNPYYGGDRAEADHWPVSRAAQRRDGAYEGFVMPGPGAVLVKPRNPGDFRAARVDPKAFFAPGWTNPPVKEQFPLYGTMDTLTSRGPNGSVPQNDYAAIVLINPPRNSAPLELSATLERSAARRVSLVDPEGRPVVGARMTGTTFDRWNPRRTLRAASFSLNGIHPARGQRITFFHDDRKLIGFLAARGDDTTQYTVRMQPWGTIIGRLVDDSGKPLPIWKPANDYKGPPKLFMDVSDDQEGRDPHYADTDAQGRFRIDQLVPGLGYSANAYHNMQPATDTIFANLVPSAGEVRDLGDFATKLSFEPSYQRPGKEERRNIADVPEEAWGESIDGLRAAIVLRSPAVDKNERLGYDVVVENVSDHDIRFGAGNHYEYGFSKMALVDADGKPAPRVPGTLPTWVDTLTWHRYWLKPGERAVISPASEQLLKLDRSGQPIPPPKEHPYYHVTHVRPGKYSVWAALEFGSGMQSYDAATGPQKVVFAAPGERQGKLQTGVAAATIFEDADQ